MPAVQRKSHVEGMEAESKNFGRNTGSISAEVEPCMQTDAVQDTSRNWPSPAVVTVEQISVVEFAF